VLDRRPLTETEVERRVRPARDRVFANLDPFGQPFTARLSDRDLLFPVSFELEAGQLAALRGAAATVGDDSAFLLLLAGTPDEPHYWELPSADASPYEPFDFLLENALLSPSGQWGMLISSEDHAVIAGAPVFMQVIRERFPQSDHPTEMSLAPPPDRVIEIISEYDSSPEMFERIVREGTPVPTSDGDTDARRFVRYWRTLLGRERHEADWVERLLAHVYGVDQAQGLLTECGWYPDLREQEEAQPPRG